VASAGATLTRGNSETFLGTIGINSARKWSKDEILLGASAGYGETTTVGDRDPATGEKDIEHNTTDRFIKGFGQWNHFFANDRIYGGIRADALNDDVAGVDYRVTLSPLIGYYLIKNAKTFLAAEAGPGFVFENLEDQPSDQYVTLRFAERFEHKFSDAAKVWQSVEYLPRVEDFGDYVINFEIGASAAITKSVELRLVLQDTYRSEPPNGRKENDLKLIASVGYRF
jgi:putative salt-induced outer membrane protein YdiY